RRTAAGVRATRVAWPHAAAGRRDRDARGGRTRLDPPRRARGPRLRPHRAAGRRDRRSGGRAQRDADTAVVAPAALRLESGGRTVPSSAGRSALARDRLPLVPRATPRPPARARPHLSFPTRTPNTRSPHCFAGPLPSAKTMVPSPMVAPSAQPNTSTVSSITV